MAGLHDAIFQPIHQSFTDLEEHITVQYITKLCAILAQQISPSPQNTLPYVEAHCKLDATCEVNLGEAVVPYRPEQGPPPFPTTPSPSPSLSTSPHMSRATHSYSKCKTSYPSTSHGSTHPHSSPPPVPPSYCPPYSPGASHQTRHSNNTSPAHTTHRHSTPACTG